MASSARGLMRLSQKMVTFARTDWSSLAVNKPNRLIQPKIALRALLPSSDELQMRALARRTGVRNLERAGVPRNAGHQA